MTMSSKNLAPSISSRYSRGVEISSYFDDAPSFSLYALEYEIRGYCIEVLQSSSLKFYNILII